MNATRRERRAARLIARDNGAYSEWRLAIIVFNTIVWSAALIIALVWLVGRLS
jgi:hypothetical protein